jgi:predicted  nucleic acid-binding Zn-ribbon protein
MNYVESKSTLKAQHEYLEQQVKKLQQANNELQEQIANNNRTINNYVQQQTELKTKLGGK